MIDQENAARARPASLQEILGTVERVRALPYVWPHEPTAEAARAAGCGSCASKHALLAEELARLGVDSRPLFVAGPLVPPSMLDDPAFADAGDILEVHELLTVIMPDVGPCLVDITWDPPLIERGFPGVIPWDGRSDTPLAMEVNGPGWAPPRDGQRAAKEALRARLYGPGQRAVRDRVLKEMSDRFARWRSDDAAGAATA